MSKKELAIIDGDLIVWQAASVCDGKWFSLQDTEGNMFQFDNKTSANQTADYLKGVSRKDILTQYDPEPIENVLHNAKLKLQFIIENSECEQYQVYLSDKTNYRYEINPSYKQNRKGMRKPFHLDNVRDYLTNYWDAIVLKNLEADDALGINQTDTTVLCSIDKDLDCIPGYHYNWLKDISYEVSEIEAMRNFYTQLITGDPTDNIMGLSERAPKRRTYKTKPIEDMDSIKEMHDYVFEGYALKYCDDAWANMKQNAGLLWICRSEDDIDMWRN